MAVAYLSREAQRKDWMKSRSTDQYLLSGSGIDEKHQRRLTAPELEAGSPEVSLDGKQVVYYNHQNTPKPTSIFKMNLDGSSITGIAG